MPENAKYHAPHGRAQTSVLEKTVVRMFLSRIKVLRRTLAINLG